MKTKKIKSFLFMFDSVLVRNYDKGTKRKFCSNNGNKKSDTGYWI